MADLGQILNARIPVKFDFHGTEINIAYRPYSEAIEQKVKGDEDWNGESMKGLVAEVLIDWDLTSQGEPLPITMETLATLPVELRFQLFFAVQNDLRDPKLPNVTSGATS